MSFTGSLGILCHPSAYQDFICHRLGRCSCLDPRAERSDKQDCRRRSAAIARGVGERHSAHHLGLVRESRLDGHHGRDRALFYELCRGQCEPDELLWGHASFPAKLPGRFLRLKSRRDGRRLLHLSGFDRQSGQAAGRRRKIMARLRSGLSRRLLRRPRPAPAASMVRVWPGSTSANTIRRLVLKAFDWIQTNAQTFSASRISIRPSTLPS